MTSFDSWEDRIRSPESYLMHSGKKGMKHGQRRYQNEDGTWTELGLAERRKREGFGERRAAKKAAKAERKQARKAIRAEARAALAEKRRKRNIKNLTDEELQARINRLKMEKEYKDLNKNPAVELGMKLVKSYLDSKDRKIKQENDRANIIIRDRESKAKLINAKAANTTAKNELLDNVVRGKGYMKAKNDYIKTRSEHTISGAIRKGISGIISKESKNVVKEMPDHSITLKGARKVKGLLKRAITTEAELVKAAYGGAGDAYLNKKLKRAKKKKAKASENPLKG